MIGTRRVRSGVLVFAALAALAVPAAAAGDHGSGGGGGGGAPPPPTAGATFQPLGLLPGTIQSFGEGVSSDGNVVVGFATSANGVDHAFRWTAATGLQELSGVGVLAAEAYAANSDGSVIVGTAWDGSGFGHHAFRWTPTGGMQLLQLADGLDESSDGSVVVGGGVWTQSGGLQPPIGSLGGGGGAYSEGVSPDGGTIVGWSPASNGFLHAFTWTSATGMTDLGVTDGTESVAQDVSAGGSAVVGQARDANGFWRAFRWTAADGMRDLGTLGGPMSVAYKVTDDGTAAVGTSLTTGSSVSNHAFRWSTTRGMEDLQAALANAGATGLNGWILYSANGISADGTVIVGTGLDPSRNWVAWRATLPR